MTGPSSTPKARRRDGVASPAPCTLTVDQRRRFYAEEIRVVAGIRSQALVEAFVNVPREHFLGIPPWRYSSGFSLQTGAYRATEDIRDLYHDVFVALKQQEILNNGQPSLIARLLEALDLGPGKRVAHIGCGTGYYSAILAEIVGQSGSVVALEVDGDLAAQAAANLREYRQVKLLHLDGARAAPGHSDAILVNAGVTHVPAAWLHDLAPRGVLVVPLLIGKDPSSSDSLVVRIVRDNEGFAATPLTVLTIYPSPSLRDASMLVSLHAAFESRKILGLHSVRAYPHEREESCIVHSSLFCLSSDPVRNPATGKAG